LKSVQSVARFASEKCTTRNPRLGRNRVGKRGNSVVAQFRCMGKGNRPADASEKKMSRVTIKGWQKRSNIARNREVPWLVGIKPEGAILRKLKTRRKATEHPGRRGTKRSGHSLERNRREQPPINGCAKDIVTASGHGKSRQSAPEEKALTLE